MTIKPIDIQTNIGQMHEVARTQQALNESLAAQMQHLDKEAMDKAQTADSRLDESKESQHLTNRLDEHKDGSGRRHRGKREPGKKGSESTNHVQVVEDQSLGRFIDVKK
jgi:hypothetical protein